MANGAGVEPVSGLAAERRRRTLEFGYRVCGLWTGGHLDGRLRICVMPRGHSTSPHRDVDGADLAGEDPAATGWPSLSR